MVVNFVGRISSFLRAVVNLFKHRSKDRLAIAVERCNFGFVIIPLVQARWNVPFNTTAGISNRFASFESGKLERELRWDFRVPNIVGIFDVLCELKNLASLRFCDVSEDFIAFFINHLDGIRFNTFKPNRGNDQFIDSIVFSGRDFEFKNVLERSLSFRFEFSEVLLLLSVTQLSLILLVVNSLFLTAPLQSINLGGQQSESSKGDKSNQD